MPLSRRRIATPCSCRHICAGVTVLWDGRPSAPACGSKRPVRDARRSPSHRSGLGWPPQPAPQTPTAADQRCDGIGAPALTSILMNRTRALTADADSCSPVRSQAQSVMLWKVG